MKSHEGMPDGMKGGRFSEMQGNSRRRQPQEGKSIATEVSARLLTRFFPDSSVGPSWIFPEDLMPINLSAS
jgi:hypothetical protein